MADISNGYFFLLVPVQIFPVYSKYCLRAGAGRHSALWRQNSRILMSGVM